MPNVASRLDIIRSFVIRTCTLNPLAIDNKNNATAEIHLYDVLCGDKMFLFGHALSLDGNDTLLFGDNMVLLVI